MLSIKGGDIVCIFPIFSPFLAWGDEAIKLGLFKVNIFLETYIYAQIGAKGSHLLEKTFDRKFISAKSHPNPKTQ